MMSEASTHSPQKPNALRSHSRRRLIYAAVTMAVLQFVLLPGMLPVYRNHLQEYLGIGDDIFGLIFSTQPLGKLLTVLLAGVLVDRLGARKMMRVSFLGVAGTFALIAVAGQSWIAFLLGLVVFGAFVAALGIASNSYLIGLFSHCPRRILSLNFAFRGMGGSLFPILAERLLVLSQTTGTIAFSMIVHVPFAIAAAILLLVSFLYRKKKTFAVRDAARSARFHWRSLLVPMPTFLLTFLVGLHAMADGTLLVWMARFLGGASFEEQTIGPGYVLAGRSVAYVASRGLLAIIPEGRGQTLTMTLPGLLGGGALIAGILSRDYTLTVVGYILGAFLWSMEWPALMSVAAREDPARFGSALALQQLLAGGLVFLGVAGIGFLSTWTRAENFWQVMLLPASLFVMVGLGAVAWLKRYGDRIKAVY